MNLLPPLPPLELNLLDFDSATKLSNNNKRYKLKIQIAHNTYCLTYKASDKVNNCDVLVKIINIVDKTIGIDEIQNEITFLSNTEHCKQITKYQTSFIFESNLWIVMEYVDSDNIYNMIQDNGQLIESNIAYILREILLGLDYLHSQKIVHRNIKCSNIFCSRNGDIKLSDFGEASKIFSKNDFGPNLQLAYWFAPEVITESLYSSYSDIWSVGITAIELATGFPPHFNNKKISLLQVVYSIPNNPVPVLEGDFSEEFKDFVKSCLHINIASRFTIAELLNHPFINGASKICPDSLLTICNKQYESIKMKNDTAITFLEGRGMCKLNSNSSSDSSPVWDFDLNNLHVLNDDYLRLRAYSTESYNKLSFSSATLSPGFFSSGSFSSGPSPIPSPRNSFATNATQNSLELSAFDSVLKVLRQYKKSNNLIPLSELFNRILKPTFPTLVLSPDDSSPNFEKSIIVDNEKKTDIRNIMNVLVASLSALDLVSEGRLTRDFLASITGHMMEELDLDKMEELDLDK